MSIVKDIPKERRNFVAKTIVSLLISILVLISLYLDFNTLGSEITKVIASICIPLGWFIIYPFALDWYLSITDQHPRRMVRLWTKFVKEILPFELTFSLAFISGVVLAFFTTGMIVSLRDTLDPKMIFSYVCIFIFISTLCLIITRNHYSKVDKNPPKMIQVYFQTISKYTFTISIVYFVIFAISCDFILEILFRLILIIFR